MGEKIILEAPCSVVGEPSHSSPSLTESQLCIPTMKHALSDQIKMVKYSLFILCKSHRIKF